MGDGGRFGEEAPVDWFGTPLTPLAGGYSGETFLVGDDPADQVVMRIYRRNPDRAAIDASLLRLVKGIIPVPEVLELRPATGETPAVLVTEHLGGVLLERVLREDKPGLDWITLGINVGEVLGALSGMPFLTAGMFAGPDLTITTEDMPTDLVDWAQHLRDTGRLAAWSDPDWHDLLALIDLADDLLEAGQNPRRVVLSHSDFNPKNLLVDPGTGAVTGVLDWEFAHAGSPYSDLGNLTRFERQPDFVEAVLSALVEHAPMLADEPLDLARAADLWALIELSGRAPSNPLGELASELLLAQARASSLQAWPWPTPRVDP